MNISEIRELENSRKSPDMYGRIHFIKEGNFYRAHDISAWLISFNQQMTKARDRRTE
jgi:hypothetical protein